MTHFDIQSGCSFQHIKAEVAEEPAYHTRKGLCGANFVATTSCDTVFYRQGYVYKLKAYEIPGPAEQSCVAIVNLLPLQPGDKCGYSIRDFEDARYLFLQRGPECEKTILSEYASSRKTGLIAINLPMMMN